MVVGVTTAPMRPQARVSRLSLSLVSEAAVALAALSATTPSARSVTARARMWATTPAAGSAKAPATSSAKVPVSESPAVPAAVAADAHAARSTTASTGTVQVLGPPPKSEVAVRDERLSVSRAAPAVTVEVAGRAVRHQEVAVVSLPEFEHATASPIPVAAVMAMTAVGAIATVVVAPAPLVPQAAYGAAQQLLWCPPARRAAKLPEVQVRAQGSKIRTWYKRRQGAHSWLL